MVSTTELLRYIIGELSERRLDVTKTALVKLLYLADVEAVRHRRPRISTLNWISYRYGPYAFEIQDALREVAGKDIDELARISALGRAYSLYRGPAREETPGVGPEERGIINKVLERWAGEELNRILNYVYFETEPMLDAEWEKPLNFDLIRPWEIPVSLADYLASRVDRPQAERLAQLKKEFLAKARTGEADLVEPSAKPRYDEIFVQGLKATIE